MNNAHACPVCLTVHIEEDTPREKMILEKVIGPVVMEQSDVPVQQTEYMDDVVKSYVCKNGHNFYLGA